ncbi:CDP-alcohol phosphatidyltransferase family protein [Rhodobacter sp. Har01]|uniref:CDP-alcohol phosphatidyltransferase family protein n=1 Tax=Rhodobacter sp. Har01 TaxID=2883999 RepID=UPI001D0753BD|nr:CDP-alcohol phosphatidyltransferase family protein [Rhodobacter sp. Har01]MCB6177334.1 CDP-alcohol phosphatidyltransferase family protein [Rhodobacter sp. Har01]
MTGPASRRPLDTRSAPWARALAARLVAAGISPNRISAASVGFALLGFLCYWTAATSGRLAEALLLLLAAAAIQARLLCNLMDGMVAIEGGRASRSGAFWNEAPDRAADILLLWGAGLAAHHPALGLGAASLAVATAYLRELGRAEGLAPDFSGPMAKPHRMAALTLGSLIAALYAPAWTLAVTLWIILAGTAITILRRSVRLRAALGGR